MVNKIVTIKWVLNTIGLTLMLYATCSWFYDQYLGKLSAEYDRGVTDALSTPESKQHADAAAMMWWYETKDMNTVRERLCGIKPKKGK